MGWFSKKLKKITNTIDPIGHKIRKSYGSKENTIGGFLDPGHVVTKAPQDPMIPYERAPKRGLMPDPGTAGPTVQLGGGSGGYNYQNNPFAGQMAQAQALRQPSPPVGMAPPPQVPAMAPPQQTPMMPGKINSAFRPTGGPGKVPGMGF